MTDASQYAVPHELIARYDRPGPRYTSYPTAPEWGEVTAADARAALERVAADPRPVSLYFHLPFCEHMCLFCGCHVVVARNHTKIPRYLEAIAREIALVREIVGPKKVVQLHFGGGTPTFLSPDQLRHLGEQIWQAFSPTDDAELSVEVDPVVTRREHFEALRSVGFNRVSMGVQDFDDEIQRRTERIQPESLTCELFGTARALGFTSINLDLMYGLPGQTSANLVRSAKRVVELGADRIALFGYAHVPWMKPHQKKLETYGIPEAPERWEMFNAARVTLLEAGYQAIGFDHFARPEDELARAGQKRRLNRNFQGYTVLEPTHVLALGLSAIADAGGSYLQNAKKLADYYAAIEAGELPVEKGMRLSAEDHLRRRVITDLMCNLYVDFDAIDERFGIAFEEHFAGALAQMAPLVADGLVVRHPRALEITERGRVFMRNVAMPFDEYLGKARQSDAPRFSRTV